VAWTFQPDPFVHTSITLSLIRFPLGALSFPTPLTTRFFFLFFFFLFLFFFYSCCSHLQHRAYVKRFVSLQFLNLRESAGLLGRGISPPQGCYLTQRLNKSRQISMPRVGFEPMIPVFERARTVHALDGAATLIGNYPYT
jgi:hypothetical protein